MKIEFTKEMKKTYKILIPNMLNIHFELLMNVFRQRGYNVELLHNEGQEVVNKGLQYVHNDTCYPALLVIGQMMDALQSGKYDINKVALLVPQTGGGCRASNYIHLLRKALEKAGFGHVPVISLNMSGLESNSGFKLTLSMLRDAIAVLCYGDVMMLLENQVEPYETVKGKTAETVSRWTEFLGNEFRNKKGFSKSELSTNINNMVRDFSEIKTDSSVKKIKVGIVGEIYAKFSGLANNNLAQLLREQDCEVMIPGLIPFLIFKVDNRLEDVKLYGGSRIKKSLATIIINYLSGIENIILDVFKNYKQFVPPSSYAHVKSLVDGVIGYGNKMGEGWMLVAEMMELIENGYENIVCCQPFGCLPNHIVAKGMVRKIKQLRPEANIVPIDYDPGATRVNQENRIKLMLASAKVK